MSNKNDPIFMNLDKKVDGYENTIQLAVGSLSIFKSQIEQLSKGDFACVKFYIPEYQDASHGANIWLMSPFLKRDFVMHNHLSCQKNLNGSMWDNG
ncbi:hypothetical protein [Acinetobacter sp. WCHAc060025]|uniref:hypothetical protein n=1 Tax=Acinetobacter sp. WCHAc060025 TaxID=2518625 RepID=UPI0013EE5C84|nr:hypothetical protein [Acinetobacter sp. WCHAc060025]